MIKRTETFAMQYLTCDGDEKRPANHRIKSHSNLFPGTWTSDELFQVYLLEGLVRWNEDRAREAAEGTDGKTLRCYDINLQSSLNQLSQEMLGVQLVKDYTQSARKYTGNQNRGNPSVCAASSTGIVYKCSNTTGRKFYITRGFTS